jgi:DMSO/TMAO reductase YedYZ molybdopterin-dependent catalytic subunit
MPTPPDPAHDPAADGRDPAPGAHAPTARSGAPLLGAVLVGLLELAAALTSLRSPTATLAGWLVTTTPGPVATWFLQIFRGAARPLTIVAAAVMLVGLATLGARLVRSALTGPRSGSAAAVAARTSPEAPAAPAPLITRRALLAGLGVGGVLLLGSAMLLRPTGPTSSHVALAGRLRAARGLPPLTAAQDVAPLVAGLSPLLTPVDDFFRIDTAIALPRVERDTWRLRVHGRVAREVTLGFDELIDLGLEEHDATISCVSNEVGGGLVGTARWTGVPLRRVLELAGPAADADQLVGRSVDGWTAGFPTVLAQAPDVLVAIGMNGVELPVRHGYPARLIVPGLYGYVSATKWLTELELTTWGDYDAYWIRRGWAKRGPVKTMARIDVPRTSVTAGTVRVAGVAWAPVRGIRDVELRVDDGPWRTASCSEPLGGAVWRQWWLDVDLGPGPHTLQVRAVDGDGTRQPEGPRDVLPDGAEGWHTVRLDARAPG